MNFLDDTTDDYNLLRVDVELVSLLVYFLSTVNGRERLKDLLRADAGWSQVKHTL